MPFEKNKFGVVQYPKGDVRRLFVLLAAIDQLERPTLATLRDFTGYLKGNIDPDVTKICTQLGVQIIKEGPIYRIVDWGRIVIREGVHLVLKNDVSMSKLTKVVPIGLTEQDKMILNVLNTEHGSASGQIAKKVAFNLSENPRVHAAGIRSRLMELERKGFVKHLNNEKPVTWVKIAVPGANRK